MAQATSAEALAQWNAAATIPLWSGAAPNGGFRPQTLPAGSPPVFLRNIEQPYLRVFRPARPNGRSLLSIPGGAYTFVSIANEGVDIAREMTARGYTVLVLVYRLPGEGWAGRADVPLQDAQRAVRLIRAHSGEYGCDPAKLYAVGFSAGGHLAASLATDFAQPVYPGADKADAQSARPRAVGLIYPVISHEPGVGHAESSLRLLGESPSADLVARRSPALHVTAETPPTFLVHAMDDPAVPVDNSFIMLRALRAAKRPVEAHFFEEGGHGFGLGPPDKPVRSWIELLANWIERQEAIAAKAA
uniref:alpha/beta hydrolase n=1 Tax=Altererythrobacter segetis TaxID=1104773 RepID=UPI001FAF9287|nr:alpha/beta hydrolase [Altererythrobacter segetis]